MSPLLKKINRKSAKVCVIGLGYVGLPLAIEFAKSGFVVTGIEVDRVKVKKLRQGQSYLDDVDGQATREIKKHLHKNQLIVRENW